MSGKCVLLSIVVPTKNRSKYLKSAIESVLNLDFYDFELIISDNSDRAEAACTADWIEFFKKDSRLRYYYSDKEMSMTENCNAAVSFALGKFVFLMGDDDTVLPSLFEACRWAESESVDALVPTMSVRYYWPDLRHRFWGSSQSGHMYLDPWVGCLTFADPVDEVEKCLRRAGQGMGMMANLYHGIVSRQLLERLKRKTGSFFFSVSPDVYSSLALSLEAENLVQYSGPLSIAGSSGKSNSGRAALNAHSGDLWDDPHMKPYRDEVWPSCVPGYFGVETVWAQAALTACKKLGRDDLVKKFNYVRLYALCLLNNGGRWKSIIKAIAMLHDGRTPFVYWVKICFELMRLFFMVAWRLWKRSLRPTRRGYAIEYGPFENVMDALFGLMSIQHRSISVFPSSYKRS